jgi:5-(carboxyamino)imidazole ribonucleotide mutase
VSKDEKPLVAVIMGSDSDWPTMKLAVAMLEKFNVPYTARVVSAHRTPMKLYNFALSAEQEGYEVIIAGAGGAAHLPGMTASMTNLPVLGVPIKTSTLSGVDSLYSIVQMPKGIPVATFAIGEAGAANAGLFAVRMLAMNNKSLREMLKVYSKELVQLVEGMLLD